MVQREIGCQREETFNVMCHRHRQTRCETGSLVMATRGICLVFVLLIVSLYRSRRGFAGRVTKQSGRGRQELMKNGKKQSQVVTPQKN